MRHVAIGPVDLFLKEEGAGPVILFLHGFPLDHRMWDRQLAALADRYRVIAIDLRGFGRSGPISGPISIADFADDVAKLLDAVGIRERIFLCGLSMGGYVALQFAERHADRLSGLVLCDTRAAADSDEAKEGRRTLAAKVLLEGPGAVIEAMRPRLLAPATRRQQPDIAHEVEEMMRQTRPATMAAALEAMACRPDMREKLPQIVVPTLVLCGEQDAISPPEEMRALAAAIPNARFDLVSGAGHMSPMENPDHVNAQLRRFLEQESSAN